MQNVRLTSCALIWLLAAVGCQSQPVVQQVDACRQLPPVPAWVMQEREPKLTQRLLKELSPSPTMATKPSGN